MNTILATRAAALLLSVTLVACGGGGDDGGAPSPAAPAPAPGPTAQQGVFIDAAVQGGSNRPLHGRTDSSGRFNYRRRARSSPRAHHARQQVPRRDVSRLSGGKCETISALQKSRDFCSHSSDGNPENGIVLDDAVQSAADLFGPINFNQSTAAFALDAAVLGLLRQARGAAATLVTTERALGHLRDATFRFRYPGIWRLTFNDGTGDFAIDNEGRVRGSAVYQGKTYALMGFVAGNGGVALYASDPTDQ